MSRPLPLSLVLLPGNALLLTNSATLVMKFSFLPVLDVNKENINANDIHYLL